MTYSKSQIKKKKQIENLKKIQKLFSQKNRPSRKIGNSNLQKNKLDLNRVNLFEKYFFNINSQKGNRKNSLIQADKNLSNFQGKNTLYKKLAAMKIQNKNSVIANKIFGKEDLHSNLGNNSLNLNHKKKTKKFSNCFGVISNRRLNYSHLDNSNFKNSFFLQNRFSRASGKILTSRNRSRESIKSNIKEFSNLSKNLNENPEKSYSLNNKRTKRSLNKLFRKKKAAKSSSKRKNRSKKTNLENSKTHSKQIIDFYDFYKVKEVIQTRLAHFPYLQLLDSKKNKLPPFDPPKVITKKYGDIRGFSVNAHIGTTRNYNEDRVSVLLNAQQK